jgi:hypothetical protein
MACLFNLTTNSEFQDSSVVAKHLAAKSKHLRKRFAIAPDFSAGKPEYAELKNPGS